MEKSRRVENIEMENPATTSISVMTVSSRKLDVPHVSTSKKQSSAPMKTAVDSI